MGEPEPEEAIDYKDVQNGPVTEASRECRDIFCCILFLLNIIAMIYISIYSYTSANTFNTFRGTDSKSNICGLGATVSFPYLYFYNPSTFPDGDFTTRVCVAQCPRFRDDTLIPLVCSGRSCAYTIRVNQDGSLNGALNKDSFLGYDSLLVLNRICIPTGRVTSNAFKDYASQLSGKLKISGLGQFTSDIHNNWQWLLVGFGFSVISTLIFVFLLRWFAGLVVWVTLFGIVLLFAAIGVIFLSQSGSFSSIAVYTGNLGLQDYFTQTKYYKVYGYVSFGLSGLALILIFCCCSRLRIAVAVCEVAGDFIADICHIVLVPIFQSLILLGLWAACLTDMVLLVSAATFVARPNDVLTGIQTYKDPALTRLYYFIFGTLWCNSFIGAMGIFVVSSTCCLWYYTHGPGSTLDAPIFRSYWMVFRYHFGSLAFGSLLLALVHMLQLIVEFVKNQTPGENKVMEAIMCCVRCCLACVERIVQFINKTAYIQIALRGKNFCTAASDGFQLIWSNTLRFAIVGGVGEIMMFMGRVLITLLSSVGFYCLIIYVPSIRTGLLEPLYLLMVNAVISFMVSSLFMSVYSLAMDTILACFIVDEANQKAQGNPNALHAPQKLIDLMDIK